jgi:fumarylacetoacetate (FAA) hydrolase
MKLASYKDGSRDGHLVVVSRDLSTAHYATGIATRLQQVLDDWNFMSPQLENLYRLLNQGKARHAFAFDPRLCAAPLPRAFQRIQAGAYLTHAERVRHAGGAEAPQTARGEPLLVQGASDGLLGCCDPIVCPDEAWGIDFEAEVAVITGDVPMGCPPERALECIRLVVLANTVKLRELMPAASLEGGALLHSTLATAFSPVAVTPDELGSAWEAGRLHLPLESMCNGQRVGLCDAADEMRFHFGQLITHAARTRRLGAGTILASGPVSHKDPSHGCSSLIEKRALETLEAGAPRTGYLKHGDCVRIEMKGKDGVGLFGAIVQNVTPD